MRTPAGIRPIGPGDRAVVDRLLEDEWGSEVMVVRGELFRPAELPGFLAERDGAVVGMATYLVEVDRCEVMTLNSLEEATGIGTDLVEAVAQAAQAAGCSHLRVVTTNDNLRALRFYQRRGFRLVEVRPGAVDRSRRIKPEIPATGNHGIPIRDELELERTLD